MAHPPSSAVRVAIVGATGLVGRELLASLDERGFPIASIVPLASARSAGQDVEFRGEALIVRDAASFDFSEVDLVLMSAGKAASETLGPKAASQGAMVIDNGSYFRLHDDVPLVVPEINAEAIRQAKDKRIIANPNCSTIQLVVALAPLCALAPLRRVVASTYQAVSGAGQAGLTSLVQETQALLGGTEVPAPHFSTRIAFNCVPHIDTIDDEGHSFEELKMLRESRKILGLPTLGVVTTCVRVPVFCGHAVSFVAEFDGPMDAQLAKDAWRGAKGVVLVDEPKEAPYPTSIDVVGQDATHIGRVRTDPSVANSVAAWCMADNLRKGAAVNAVQIAEAWLRLRAGGEL